MALGRVRNAMDQVEGLVKVTSNRQGSVFKILIQKAMR